MNTDTPNPYQHFEVHEEKGLTGVFRLRRGVLECEVTIERKRTVETRSHYTTFRAARPEDHETQRVRNRT